MSSLNKKLIFSAMDWPFSILKEALGFPLFKENIKENRELIAFVVVKLWKQKVDHFKSKQCRRHFPRWVLITKFFTVPRDTKHAL